VPVTPRNLAVASVASFVFLIIVMVLLSPNNDVREVVVYTSVDQNYSEPIFKAFEEKTGIRARVVYDVEASKTTGLVHRLLAEANHPLCDVFWNGEFVQTLLLKERGVLAPFDVDTNRDIPAQFRDPERYWIGTAGRARVLLINKNRLSPSDYPASIFDLLRPEYTKEGVGIANPVFGTTATHAAALFAALQPIQGEAFFRRLSESGVAVLNGNAVVRDQVVTGQLIFGLTDTDDACGAIAREAPVTAVFPDNDTLGTLVIPGTVSLIANAPHSNEALALLRYLVSSEVEDRLIRSGWSHVPLRPSNVQPKCSFLSTMKPMNISFEAIYQQLDASRASLRRIFIR